MEATASVERQHRRQRRVNPLLLKELRGRMRGARAFVVLTIYLLLMSCMVGLMYTALTINFQIANYGFDLVQVGRVVFIVVVLVEVLLVAFITPAFTAGAITGERERRTYELLRSTLLPARKIVFGKLTAALTYMGLLVLAALPLEALAFMLGGVVFSELVLAFLVLSVTVLSVSAAGFFFSALMRTTLVATVLTYALVLLMSFVVPILALVLSSIVSYSGFLSDLLEFGAYLVVSLSPIGAGLLTAIGLEESGSLWLFDIGFSFRVPAAWLIYLGVHIPLALGLLAFTVWYISRQEIK